MCCARRLCGLLSQLEQWKRLDDASQSTTLFEVLRCISLEERVDPIVTVLDDAIAIHLRDLLESFFRLLTRFRDGTIVSCTIGDVSLHLRPEKFDRLHLRTEGRSVDQRVTSIIEQLLNDCTIVVWMLIEPQLSGRDEIILRWTT